LVRWLGVVVVLGLLAAVFFLVVNVLKLPTVYNAEGTKLHSIGQTWISFEADHPDGLNADKVFDVYELAAQLARNSGVDDPTLWFSKIDRGVEVGPILPVSILKPSPAGIIAPIDPKFQGAPLAFAVALFPMGSRFASLPATTPLAWTRGLQPNGHWSMDSPYRDSGGFVLFADGNVFFYKDGVGGGGCGLTKWGTSKDPTSNILEALPPGTRISEFKPPSQSP